MPDQGQQDAGDDTRGSDYEDKGPVAWSRPAQRHGVQRHGDCREQRREPEQGLSPAKSSDQLSLERDEDGTGEPREQRDAESNALARWAGAATATTTANAGAYKTIAEAAPIATKTAYSSITECTCDQARTAAAPSKDPVVINAWPPLASSHRPTGIDIKPVTSTAVVNAPAAVAVEIPRSRLIGPSKTLNA